MIRSFIPNYSEQEIQQWREARKKNHPSFRGQIEKVSYKLLYVLLFIKILPSIINVVV
jgi:hypothetical protein